MPGDVAEDRVQELISLYHSELTKQGVEIDLKELRWQYDVGMLNMLHRLLPTVYQGDMVLDAERGLPLLKEIQGRTTDFYRVGCLRKVPHVCAGENRRTPT